MGEKQEYMWNNKGHMLLFIDMNQADGAYSITSFTKLHVERKRLVGVWMTHKATIIVLTPSLDK